MTDNKECNLVKELLSIPTEPKNYIEWKIVDEDFNVIRKFTDDFSSCHALLMMEKSK